MRLAKIGFGVLLFVGAQASAFDPVLIKDFADLDRFLVPAIVQSNDAGASFSRSVVKLQTAWAAFSESRADDIENDPRWRGSCGEIERIVGELDSTDRDQIYTRLCAVRSKLVTLRERIGVSYFLDPIIRFREILERARPIIDELSRDESLALVLSARDEWAKLRDTHFDKILYTFDYYKMGEFGMDLDMVRSSLGRLIDTITEGDMAAAAVAFKDTYAASEAVYRLFGDFD